MDVQCVQGLERVLISGVYRGAGCGETAESACTVREGVLVLLSAVVEYDSGKIYGAIGSH